MCEEKGGVNYGAKLIGDKSAVPSAGSFGAKPCGQGRRGWVGVCGKDRAGDQREEGGEGLCKTCSKTILHLN